MGKLQDAISSLRGDTGKNWLKGLAATAGAAVLGGSAGVSALGSVTGKLNENREVRRLSDVRKAKDALTAERDQLNLDIDKEKLLEARTKRLAGDPSPDKYGKITPFDVAIEPKSERGGGGAAAKRSKADDLKLPPAVPMSATNPAFESDPDSIIAATKKAVSTGRQLGTDFAVKSGAENIGKDLYKKTRSLMGDELGQSGLHPDQIKAARQEYAAKAAPGFREEQQAIVDAGPQVNLTTQEQLAQTFPTAYATVAGMATGAKLGAPGGMFGMAAGGLLGAGIGYAGGDPIAEQLSKYAPEEPIENNPELIARAEQLVAGLKRSGVNSYDEVSAQTPTLMAMPDYQDLPANQRQNLMVYVAKQFPQGGTAGVPYSGLFSTGAR